MSNITPWSWRRERTQQHTPYMTNISFVGGERGQRLQCKIPIYSGVMESCSMVLLNFSGYDKEGTRFMRGKVPPFVFRKITSFAGNVFQM